MNKHLCAVGLSLCLIAGGAVGQQRQQTGIFGAGQPGEVSIVRMEAKKLGLKNFKMDSRQVDGRLAIDGFSGNLGNGTLQGQGLVDWSRPQDAQRMTIQVQNVPAMELFNAFKVKLNARIDAIASGVIDTQWRGVRGTTPRETMNGSVRIQLGPGRISGADVLRHAASYTGIAEVQQLEFQSAVIEGTIRDGMMSVTRLDFIGTDRSAKGVGALDLRTEELRLKFEGYLAPALIARSTNPQVRALGKSGGASQVRVPLPVIFSGNARAPQFSMAWETAREVSQR